MMTSEPEYDPEAERGEEEEKAQGFKLIGEFTFWYSQLEFTIKARLAAAVSISDELFDTIISPYEFITLCTVTKNVLMKQYPNQKDQRAIAKVFNACAALNTERVRVAHGMWTHWQGGLMASHVARGTLQRGDFFEKPEELARLIEKAKRLMLDVMEVPLKPKRTVGSVERIGMEIMPDEKPTK